MFARQIDENIRSNLFRTVQQLLTTHSYKSVIYNLNLGQLISLILFIQQI